VSAEVTDDRERSRYEITEDGRPVGFLTYRTRPGLIDLVHTEIDPAHGGRGLAAVLVRHALDDARARGLAVIPHCPYVSRFIARHPDGYRDLVPAERRAQFGLA
jgi:predicted GNAT family acetyltransferase